jgi:hypothetical protein
MFNPNLYPERHSDYDPPPPEDEPPSSISLLRLGAWFVLIAVIAGLGTLLATL